MTKRPRFTANLQVSEKRQIPAKGRALAVVSERGPAVTVDVAPDLWTEVPAFVEQEAAVDLRADAVDAPAGDSLPAIFGDAFMAVSLASSASLTQGLRLQLRLSAYMLGLQWPGPSRH